MLNYLITCSVYVYLCLSWFVFLVFVGYLGVDVFAGVGLLCWALRDNRVWVVFCERGVGSVFLVGVPGLNTYVDMRIVMFR